MIDFFVFHRYAVDFFVFRHYSVDFLLVHHYAVDFLLVHHYAVDVFVINLPVLNKMPYVSCIKHAINLTELQKRYDTPLKMF